MTLTILASVSLLALVSSARPLPLLKLDEDSWNGLQIPASGEDGDIQQVIQAVVKSHMSPDLKEEDDLQIQLATSGEVQSYLSTADNDISIKALIPLGSQDELHSPDEKELYELLNRLEEERAGRSASPVPDDALDAISLTSALPLDLDTKVQSSDPSFLGASSPHGEREKISDMNSDVPIPSELFTSMPIIVMAVSCAIALISVCCVAAALYIADILKTSVFRSTWGILPRLKENLISDGARDTYIGGEVSENDGKYRKIEIGANSASVLVFGSEKMPGALPVVNMAPSINSVYRPNLPRIYISSTDRTLREANFDGSEEPESDTGDDQDMDEKFFDAEDTGTNGGPPPSYSYDPKVLPSPSGGVGSSPPGLAALAAATATVTAVAVAHAPEMHQKKSNPDAVPVEQSSTSPIFPADASNSGPRPSWSVRAHEAGALIRARETVDQDNDHRQRPRLARGSGMFAAPQLDAALAMQLRPGLGVGADAAWIVRFVMALLGWCAVLMGGGRWGL